MRWPNQSVAERFWAKVEWSPTCWLWQASTKSQKKPYGQFSIGRKMITAHRVAWFLTYGYWPSDCLLHICDVYQCVRPSHLQEGSVADNNKDMLRKGRQTHTLSEQQVREIHAAAASGEKYETIAARFNTTNPNVHYIATGQSWRWLNLPVVRRNKTARYAYRSVDS